MRAEELEKPIANRRPIPKGLEKSLGELARITVRTGADPVKVVMALQAALIIWRDMTPEEREAVRRELRQKTNPRVPHERKPRRFRRELP